MAASGSIVAPWRRTSAVTNPGISDALSSVDFDSETAGSLRSLVSTPLPFGPPPCTSTRATSSDGSAA